MKAITDLQDIIKNNQKLYIIVEYENITSNLEKLYFSEAREVRLFRIFQNFANAQNISIYVYFNGKTSKREINQFSKRLKNIEFLNDKESIIEVCDNMEEKSTALYIGNDKNILKLDKIKEGYTIYLTNEENGKNKLIDFNLTAEEFNNIILETNNLYL